MSWRFRLVPAKAGDTTTLRDDGDRDSLNLHAMIAVDARDGAMLGPVHAEFLRREGGKRDDRGKRAFEERESRRHPRSRQTDRGAS